MAVLLWHSSVFFPHQLPHAPVAAITVDNAVAPRIKFSGPVFKDNLKRDHYSSGSRELLDSSGPREVFIEGFRFFINGSLEANQAPANPHSKLFPTHNRIYVSLGGRNCAGRKKYTTSRYGKWNTKYKPTSRGLQGEEYASPSKREKAISPAIGVSK